MNSSELNNVKCILSKPKAGVDLRHWDDKICVTAEVKMFK